MNTLLEKYAELVAEWGKKMNLVSDPEKGVVMAHHVTDCVRAHECLEAHFTGLKRYLLPIVDIGSGAGFPGIVWAILSPSTKVFLVEPREKRVTFLKHVASKLGLKNVEVICSRFENVSRETFSNECLFTSRAVGYDADLTDLMLKDVATNRSVWAVMSGPESLEKLRSGVRRAVVESESLAGVKTESCEYILDGGLGGRAVFTCYKG